MADRNLRRATGLILTGAYYPLTLIHRTPDQWMARQTDCHETGCGLIQGIRLPSASEETLTVRPKEIHPDAISFGSIGLTDKPRASASPAKNLSASQQIATTEPLCFGGDFPLFSCAGHKIPYPPRP